MEEKQYLAGTIPALEVAQLKEGVNLIGTQFLVFKGQDGPRATRNICRHQGGRFRKLNGNRVECSRHGWVLDCAMMRYTNPPDILSQDELRIEQRASGDWALWSSQPHEPWGEPTPLPLAKAEYTIQYMAHACAIISAGRHRIATDPWLTGPAFLRGWWLQHAPPDDWLEQLSTVSAIFISHAHSDHLNYPTLSRLAAVNPSIPIFVPRMAPKVWSGEFEKLPFAVHEVDIDTWLDNGPLRIMFLRDSLAPDLDTAMLFEYKGHRVLNTVDCSQPNGNHLPKADVLLSDFASGASGFPSCFADMFGDKTPAMVRQKRLAFLQKTYDILAATKPSAFIPFAGFFTEAHPLDREIRELNVKNSAMDAAKGAQARGVTAWVPHPGGVFDIATLTGTAGEVHEPEWDFDETDRFIRTSMDFEPLQSMRGVQRYFDWAGFSGYELCLHVVEEWQGNTVREYFVDFRSITLSDTAPTGLPVIRMRVHADSLRYVMQHGLSWDVIYIGFQARFFVSPDIYHMRFWNHFARLEDKAPITWHDL
jgi:CMP-N-acetylneuraminate monooxygenase